MQRWFPAIINDQTDDRLKVPGGRNLLPSVSEENGLFGVSIFP